MKYAMRLAAVAVAAASVLAVGSPSHATSATELAVSGVIGVGSGLEQGGAGVAVGGSCVGSEVTTQPSAAGYVCGMSTSGMAQGLCPAWSATVSGTISPVLSTGATGGYRVDLTVTYAQGALAITGTAVGPDGTTKTVAGTGAATPDLTTWSMCGTNPHTYQWAATLAIVG